MLSNFQALSMEQEQVSVEKQEASDQDSGETENKFKNKFILLLWRNIQKIVTILVLIYLIALIVNLLSCKQSFLTVELPLELEDGARLDGEQLQVEQNSQASRLGALRDILRDSSEVQEQDKPKQGSTETANSQAIVQMPFSTQQKKQSAPENSQTVSKHPEPTLGILPPSLSMDFASDHQSNAENFQFIEDQIARRSTEEHEKAKSKLRSIYSELNDNSRLSLYSLPFEQTREIVAEYASSESFLLGLLEQNGKLDSSSTELDLKHLSQLSEKYLKKEQPSQPLCVILSTHNNAHNQQIVRTLNSIYSQHYEPYQVVIAARPSSDKTPQIIKNYIKTYADLASKTTFVEIDTDSEAFAVWSAAKSCRQEGYAMYLDGNTELLGKEVFKLVNYYFSQQKTNVIYGDHYLLDVSEQKFSHFNAQVYDESEKFMLGYRVLPKKFGKLFAFKAYTIGNLPERFLKFNSDYFEYSGIDSIAVTLLEMSCGRIGTINEPLGMAWMDSKIEQEETEKRRHELKLISQKLKMDQC